ncbi:MAG: EVE domain-containing protein [Myxococcota bacterium]
MAPQYWLAKSEPDVYSIDDLARDGKTSWEGVRNYQARNHLRSMRVGDAVLFYHSNAEPSGVAGVATVAREAYPDPAAWDPKSEYYDPGASPEDPRWSMVDLAFAEKLRVVPLAELKADPALAGLEVIRKGSRLSVTAVRPEHFQHVLALGRSGASTPVTPPPAKKKPAVAKKKPTPAKKKPAAAKKKKPVLKKKAKK